VNTGRLFVSYKYHKDNVGKVNLGDCTQSIAVENLLDACLGIKDAKLVDRDLLDEYQGDPIRVPMQGWFTYNGLKNYEANKMIDPFPVAENINPVFVGFHLSMEGYSRKYFKENKPKLESFGGGSIGCRDVSTYKFLKSLGYPAYVSFCMTATLPKRKVTNKQVLNFCVDCEPKDGEISLSNEHPVNKAVDESVWKEYEQRSFATLMMLGTYAKHVRTSRLHIYLPCVAMGIPVTYEGVSDERTDIIKIINKDTIKDIKPLIIQNFISQFKGEGDRYVDELMKFVK
jgi:hypothetical protein